MAKTDNIPVRAFVTKSDGIINKLINKVIVHYNGKAYEVVALWDTGATETCISHQVVDKLGLIPTGKINVYTPSGAKLCNQYLTNITLPNNVTINDIVVSDSEIGEQGIGVLVGMNIINLGDFCVSNYNGKTFFSYRFPSIEHGDFVQKVNMQRIIGKSHGKGKKKKK